MGEALGEECNLCTGLFSSITFDNDDLCLCSNADPLRALLITPLLSPEFMCGMYTGGCSPSVASSSGPTYMTVSADKSLLEGSGSLLLGFDASSPELPPEPALLLAEYLIFLLLSLCILDASCNVVKVSE